MGWTCGLDGGRGAMNAQRISMGTVLLDNE